MEVCGKMSKDFKYLIRTQYIAQWQNTHFSILKVWVLPLPLQKNRQKNLLAQNRIAVNVQ
jgi:hypothetical protein